MSSAEELTEIRRLIEKQDMRFRRLESALIGDSKMGIKGIVQKVEYHGKKISDFDKDRTKVLAGATALGAVASAAVSFFNKIFG